MVVVGPWMVFGTLVRLVAQAAVPDLLGNLGKVPSTVILGDGGPYPRKEGVCVHFKKEL